jgi:hypothetical protein
MPSIVTFLYPAVDFDLDYYLTSHMPMVQKKWASYGLLDWYVFGSVIFWSYFNSTDILSNRKVVKLDPATGNCVQCILEWQNAEAFPKALAATEGVEVLGDIKSK